MDNFLAKVGEAQSQEEADAIIEEELTRMGLRVPGGKMDLFGTRVVKQSGMPTNAYARGNFKGGFLGGDLGVGAGFVPKQYAGGTPGVYDYNVNYTRPLLGGFLDADYANYGSPGHRGHQVGIRYTRSF